MQRSERIGHLVEQGAQMRKAGLADLPTTIALISTARCWNWPTGRGKTGSCYRSERGAATGAFNAELDEKSRMA